jgi:hypothetical protein
MKKNPKVILLGDTSKHILIIRRGENKYSSSSSSLNI